jgi:hypothetical protein
VQSFKRQLRGVFAAFLGIVALYPTLGDPGAAYALPANPGDTCVPQPVTAADAELLGTLRLLDVATVGLESRISMQSPSVRNPDPKCDGQYIQVPLVFRWDVLGRPTGSTAALTTTSTTTARLVPDAAGDWQVQFTACPNGCRVTGTTLTVPPQRRSITFSSTAGIEGRMSQDFLDSSLRFFLVDSRIQISHTGAGQNISGTPYTVKFFPLTQLFQKRCLVPDPASNCDELEDKMTSSVTLHTITPSLSSFIDFGPTAEKFKAPSFIVLPVEPHEHDIPLWKRGVFLGLQTIAGGFIQSVDIDRVRLLANDIHLDFKSGADKWQGTIDGGSLNLQMAFDSEHPSIRCEAHYTKRVGFIFSVDSGWADEMCPDYDLSQMDMTIHFFPAVVNDTLVLNDATVDVHLTPGDVTSDLYDYFFDVSAEQQTNIANKVRARLVETGNREKLGDVLLELLKHRFPDLVRVHSSQIVGSDWVVRYDNQ